MSCPIRERNAESYLQTASTAAACARPVLPQQRLFRLPHATDRLAMRRCSACLSGFTGPQCSRACSQLVCCALNTHCCAETGNFIGQAIKQLSTGPITTYAVSERKNSPRIHSCAADGARDWFKHFLPGRPNEPERRWTAGHRLAQQRSRALDAAGQRHLHSSVSGDRASAPIHAPSLQNGAGVGCCSRSTAYHIWNNKVRVMSHTRFRSDTLLWHHSFFDSTQFFNDASP